MRSLWKIFLAIWLAHFALSAPVNVDVEDGLSPPDLTPEEFQTMKGTYFVKFFSPYCGHCKALAPKWDAAYRKVGGTDTPGFQWANVDCVQFSDFCMDQSIVGYPTLRVYRDGRRMHDLSSSGPSEADLIYFAEQYMKVGDKALDAQYEVAPAEVVDREAAGRAEEEMYKQIEEDDKKDQNGEPKKEGSKDNELKKGESKKEQPKKGDSTKIEDETVEQSSSKKSPNSPEEDYFSEMKSVSVWQNGDLDSSKSVGRWSVLFIGPECNDCKSVLSKWVNHDNFARDIPNINWSVVDCGTDAELCSAERVSELPAIRIYEDGQLRYTYVGPTDSFNLRALAKHASEVRTFVGFDLFDLENTANSEDAAVSQPELAGPADEPQYLQGPVVTKPDYNGQRPKLSDVVKYTIDTMGQPIDDDPGKLIFGDSPEAHHNFRTWSAPNAPPPPLFEPGSAASHADGLVKELSASEFEKNVKRGQEPWLIKFYSPKCPHCREMIAAYEETARKLKGTLNVGAVNCESDSDVCRAENIDAWPTINIYRGPVSIGEFTGARTVSNLVAYAKRAFNSQIYPLDSEQQLTEEIIANMGKQLTTYVYLYDESVMSEDWESLSTVASNIAQWGGVLYRTNNADLRELAGIKHRGTAFVNVDLSGDSDTGKLKWYDYPFSNIPKKIRDATEVTQWAYRAKWSSIQLLNPAAMTEFSPYIAVLLTDDASKSGEDKSLLEHKRLSLEFRDFYRERQIEDQDRMRVDRLKQHDKALMESNFKLARHIMLQPLNNPLSVDLAFAYIPLKQWTREYSKYLDVAKHQVGDVIVLDFYNGVYLDEFNLVPIKDDKEVLKDSAELLQRYEFKDPKTSFRSIRKFKKSVPGIPKPSHRSTHFHLKPISTDQSIIARVFKVMIASAILYLLYRKFLRSKLRKYAARNHDNGTESWQETSSKHD